MLSNVSIMVLEALYVTITTDTNELDILKLFKKIVSYNVLNGTGENIIFKSIEFSYIIIALTAAKLQIFRI